MSSHRLSVSGERQFQLTGGGGPYSAIQYPARPEDAAAISVGSAVVEIAVPDGARLERRVYKDTHSKGTREIAVLVLPHGMTAWATPLYENGVMHTNVDVRRPDGKANPVALSADEVSREVVNDDFGRQVYTPAPDQLTEVHLINALHERGVKLADEGAPTHLAVGDRRTELAALRILAVPATDPQPVSDGEDFAALEPTAANYSKLRGLEVVIDPDLGDDGWELR